MSMLIKGLKQLGNDINLYLRLLKDELDTLWDEPANTWDAYGEGLFHMKAALVTTVHDYLGYDMSRGRWCTDSMYVLGAWMTQCITS